MVSKLDSDNRYFDYFACLSGQAYIYVFNAIGSAPRWLPPLCAVHWAAPIFCTVVPSTSEISHMPLLDKPCKLHPKQCLNVWATHLVPYLFWLRPSHWSSLLIVKVVKWNLNNTRGHFQSELESQTLTEPLWPSAKPGRLPQILSYWNGLVSLLCIGPIKSDGLKRTTSFHKSYGDPSYRSLWPSP